MATVYIRFQKKQKYYLGQPIDPPEYEKGEQIGDDFYTSIEECENEYLWIPIPNEYICVLNDETDKYSRYEKLQAHDKVTSEPIDPPMYITGNYIGESDASFKEECEGVVEWKLVEGEYLCVLDGDTYTRYEKLQAYNKNTGEVISPYQYKEGGILATGCTSEECNGSPRTETILIKVHNMDGYKVNENEIKESLDCGATWETKGIEYVADDLNPSVYEEPKSDAVKIDFPYLENDDNLYRYAFFLGTDNELYLLHLSDYTGTADRANELAVKDLYKLDRNNYTFAHIGALQNITLMYNPSSRLTENFEIIHSCNENDAHFYNKFYPYINFGFYYNPVTMLFKSVYFNSNSAQIQTYNLYTNEVSHSNELDYTGYGPYTNTYFLNDGEYFYLLLTKSYANSDYYGIIPIDGSSINISKLMTVDMMGSDKVYSMYDKFNDKYYISAGNATVGEEKLFAEMSRLEGNAEFISTKDVMFDFEGKDIKGDIIDTKAGVYSSLFFSNLKTEPVHINSYDCREYTNEGLSTFVRVYYNNESYLLKKHLTDNMNTFNSEDIMKSYSLIGIRNNYAYYCNDTTLMIINYLNEGNKNILYKFNETDETICDGTSKYKKMVYQKSTDDGQTWENVEPVQYQKGELIEEESYDCGYVAYRWEVLNDETMCDGADEYYVETYQQSTNGTDWVNVEPLQTRKGSLKQSDSETCMHLSDVVMYNSNENKLEIVPDIDENVDSYPKDVYTPIGIVLSKTLDYGDGSYTVMALKQLSNIFFCNSSARLPSNVPLYSTFADALNDFDGKGTTKLLSNNTDHTWTVINEVMKYSTMGTESGDWYVPSLGEVMVMETKNNTNRLQNKTLEFIANNYGINVDTIDDYNTVGTTSFQTMQKMYRRKIQAGSNLTSNMNVSADYVAFLRIMPDGTVVR